MLRIDNNLLQEVGLGSLPDSEKNSLLRHIYETLEMRVGIRLADQMSNEQLDEFERYFEAKDDAGAFKWLETNFPNYKEIVQEEFEKLKAEVAQSAPQILSSSVQQAQMPQAMPQQAAFPQADPYAPTATPQMPAQQPVAPAPSQPGMAAMNHSYGMTGEINTPTQPVAMPQAAPGNPYNNNPQVMPQQFANPQQPPMQPPMPPFPTQQPPAGPSSGQ